MNLGINATLVLKVGLVTILIYILCFLLLMTSKIKLSFENKQKKRFLFLEFHY